MQSSERLTEIGGIAIEHPFTLAALSGYSDMGMRMACRSLGACLTRHEVVLDQFIVAEGRGSRSGKHMDSADRPVVCQLMGYDPAVMADAAVKMVGFGYDMVDINFGCPVKKVLGRCRGGFLLSEPETAIEMMARVRDAVSVPVTVKMRRGTDDSPQAADRFWTILEKGVELGITAFTVHGRTVVQRYEGPSQWGILSEVKRRFPKLFLFGSGDLFTAEDCIRMLNETGCDGVTIARGAIDNPWVFRDCLALWSGGEKPAPPSLEEQGAMLDWQLQMAAQQYGPERATRQMRKFALKRAKLHPLSQEVFEAFVAMESPDQWQMLRERYYGAGAFAAG